MSDTTEGLATTATAAAPTARPVPAQVQPALARFERGDFRGPSKDQVLLHEVVERRQLGSLR